MSAASHSVIDPVELTRDLIRIPSVTPADEGAMDVLERALTGLGFTGWWWFLPLALPLIAAIVAFAATRHAALTKLRELM